MLYEHVALVDSSGLIALFDPADSHHEDARLFFETTDLSLASVRITAHEVFTRVRYDSGHLRTALEHFDFLRTVVPVLEFTTEDEVAARGLIEKYSDQTLSFHDALCGAVALRLGIYKIFGFDADYFTFGFQLVPGLY